MRDPKHPRRFTEDFRRQVVALVDSGKPRAEVMRECDLGKSTPDRWIQRVHARGSTAADNRAPGRNRLIELERENARLEMEVDVSKKRRRYPHEGDGDGGERRPLPDIGAVPHPRRAALHLLPPARRPARAAPPDAANAPGRGLDGRRPRTRVAAGLAHVRAGSRWRYACLPVDLHDREVAGVPATGARTRRS